MKKIKRSKRLFCLIVLILILVMSFFIIKDVFSAPKKTAEVISYRVTKNATMMAIIGDLKYYGFIKHESAFKLALFMESGFKRKDIQRSAIYKISQSMNVWQITNILLSKGETIDCNNGCSASNFDPELLPGGDLAPTIKQKYEWVKTYEDCVKAIGHDGGQLSSEQYYQRTGIKRCISPDGREFTQGKEGWSDQPSP